MVSHGAPLDRSAATPSSVNQVDALCACVCGLCMLFYGVTELPNKFAPTRTVYRNISGVRLCVLCLCTAPLTQPDCNKPTEDPIMKPVLHIASLFFFRVPSVESVASCGCF